jgi:tetratricopeptide (TPR) repeat protein
MRKHEEMNMKPTLKTAVRLLTCLTLLNGLPVHADTATDLQHLQERWAEVNYQVEGNMKLAAFEQLAADADRAHAASPDSAEILIWRGIIRSTWAGAKGGLGALSLVKDARGDLEEALKLDPQALQGSAYTSLGSLYYQVPGWPIGFGDDDKAEELLKQALEINPDGIDPNYFYGSYLIEADRYDEAREYLLKAQKAAPRPGRALADSGRQEEIAAALAQIAGK